MNPNTILNAEKLREILDVDKLIHFFDEDVQELTLADMFDRLVSTGQYDCISRGLARLMDEQQLVLWMFFNIVEGAVTKRPQDIYFDAIRTGGEYEIALTRRAYEAADEAARLTTLNKGLEILTEGER